MEYTLFIISAVVAAIASGLLLYINKPVYALLVILATAVSVILALLLTKNETYTAPNTFTNSFPSGTNLMLMDNTGDISFKQISVIDEAINSAANSLGSDITANFNTLSGLHGTNLSLITDNTKSINTLNNNMANYVKYSDNIGILTPNYPNATTEYMGRSSQGAGWYPKNDSRNNLDKYATLKIVKPPTLPPN